MDGMELKPKFDGLQELFNRCINHAFRVLTDRITAKSAYLDCEQMQELKGMIYPNRRRVGAAVSALFRTV